jgi:hypothetical protein
LINSTVSQNASPAKNKTPTATNNARIETQLADFEFCSRTHQWPGATDFEKSRKQREHAATRQ